MSQSTRMSEQREGGRGNRNGCMDGIDAANLDFLIDAAIIRWMNEHPDDLELSWDNDSIRSLFGRSKVVYL